MLLRGMRTTKTVVQAHASIGTTMRRGDALLSDPDDDDAQNDLICTLQLVIVGSLRSEHSGGYARGRSALDTDIPVARLASAMQFRYR